MSYRGIAEGAIHAESGMCAHAGGQLPFGGRFGSGAGKANVVGAEEALLGRGDDAAGDDGADE